MTTSTVPNNVPTPQAPTTELSWDAIMRGAFTTSPARRLFEETVISRAASAKAALPGEAGRIDCGRDLVLANRVMPQEDGTFVVYSTSERGKSYPVADSRCTCPDAAKAPEGRCKHVLSTWIWRKSRSAIAGQELPQEPGTSNGHTTGPVTAQEAPGATNGTQAAPGASPQDLSFEEEVEVSVALAANRPAPQPPQAHSEAPASVNLELKIGGRWARITLRDSDEGRLLTRLEALLQRFPLEAEATQAPTADRPDWCKKHNVEMRRFEKEGRSWYSHQLPDGSWCRGR